jgi:predicted ATPase
VLLGTFYLTNQKSFLVIKLILRRELILLDYISIDGFKSLKNVVIKNKPLQIPIGLNWSGKSSVLQFLQILQQTAPANYLDLHMNANLIKLGAFSGVVFN